MKIYNSFLMFCLMLIATDSGAQIQSVSLQASGLTCSMCSRAIYKSLKKVTEVSEVDEDIAHSTYRIRFRNTDAEMLSLLKKAVTDAGFSVARMEVGVNFDNVTVANDSTVEFSDMSFRFTGISPQTLKGKQALLILDKDYLLDKERKKFPVQESGHKEEGSERSYRVTLSQS